MDDFNGRLPPREEWEWGCAVMAEITCLYSPRTVNCRKSRALRRRHKHERYHEKSVVLQEQPKPLCLSYPSRWISMIKISSRRWERALSRLSSSLSSGSGCWRAHLRLAVRLTDGRLLTLWTTAFRLRTTRLVRRNRFDCRRSGSVGPEAGGAAPLMLFSERRAAKEDKREEE
jgi:hypothetical protein